MIRKQEFLIHLIFWIVFFGMNEYFDYVIYGETSFSYFSISLSIVQIITFYLNYFWICPKTIPEKKWILFLLGQVFLVFAFAGIRYFLEEIVLFELTGHHNYYETGRNLPYYVYDNSYFALRIILFSLFFYFGKYLLKTNQKIATLDLEKKQAELQSLKNQLSPHFLFNTLNSFYSDLLNSDPKTANDILKLSELLRYVTYENESDAVYLKDEIQFIQNYIDLFNRRFDNTLQIDFTYSEIEPSHKIPSLLLIHFVENALKHGNSNDGLPIVIQLTTQNQRLDFEVKNAYERNENYSEKGIGYKNVRQRLDIIFEGNYLLEIEDSGKEFQVHLNIPLWK